MASAKTAKNNREFFKLVFVEFVEVKDVLPQIHKKFRRYPNAHSMVGAQISK